MLEGMEYTQTVLIGVSMLFVLADSFCAVPALLITNGEQQ
jgi:hypothetical protein